MQAACQGKTETQTAITACKPHQSVWQRLRHRRETHRIRAVEIVEAPLLTSKGTLDIRYRCSAAFYDIQWQNIQGRGEFDARGEFDPIVVPGVLNIGTALSARSASLWRHRPPFLAAGADELSRSTPAPA